MKRELLENFFDTKIDKNGKEVYLLNKTIHIENNDMNPEIYKNYIAEKLDNWFLISYKAYGTIDLWWLVCKTNSIIDPLIQPEPGDIIKILNENIVESILDSIRNSD